MITQTKSLENFIKSIDDLIMVVHDANNKIIASEVEEFVYKNSNFLTKSFLINLCSHLEIYIKDALEELLWEIINRLNSHKIPYNLIRWNLESKPKWSTQIWQLLERKKRRFECFKIHINKKDFENFISWNPQKTKELFTMFWINLEENISFQSSRDIIQNIIQKRNNILHHNDNASDLSNKDILDGIEEFRKYVINLDSLIVSS